MISSMSHPPVANLEELDAHALRVLAHQLMGQLDQRDRALQAKDQQIAQQVHAIHFKETHIQKLRHEIAMLRR